MIVEVVPEPSDEESIDDQDDDESIISSEGSSLGADGSPMERAPFVSEMNSPINHVSLVSSLYFIPWFNSTPNQHRMMATPRSVLRPAPRDFLTSTSLTSSLPRQLFSFAIGKRLATPSTNKRKVAFNDEVYIQEIVDIRDKRIHWNAAVDSEESQVVMVATKIALPVSPAVVRRVSSHNLL